MSRLEVVVGSQFGSEGKGHVLFQRIRHHQHQADQDGHYTSNTVCVRVAGPNAGHCVISPESGHKYAFRTIPAGMVLGTVNHGVIGVISAGSELDMTVLEAEIQELNEHDPQILRDNSLVIDYEATLLEQHHKDEEAERGLNAKLGSTAKGIGAARADRVWRSARRVLDAPETMTRLAELGVLVTNTGALIRTYLALKNNLVIVEGTQGYGLGLHAGYYPQCTSSDCRAVDFLSLAGISPWTAGVETFQVWLATRVYPIRVAGNSGPLKGESSWQDLGLPQEYTTVTKKVRRVGEFDFELFSKAVAANGGYGNPAVKIALTMADQIDPTASGLDYQNPSEWHPNPELDDLIGKIEKTAGVSVAMITTSEKTALYNPLTKKG